MSNKEHSPLPWHLSETGFSRRSPVPTIYSTNDDLEIICKVNRDRMLSFSVQDNLSNAKFIVEACNNYERLKTELEKIEAYCARHEFNTVACVVRDAVNKVLKQEGGAQ